MNVELDLFCSSKNIAELTQTKVVLEFRVVFFFLQQQQQYVRKRVQIVFDSIASVAARRCRRPPALGIALAQVGRVRSPSNDLPGALDLWG